jgi:uncharacterized membrane protein
MKAVASAFLTSLAVMLALDAPWLLVMGKLLYAPRIGHLMADAPFLAPAAVFYLIYVLGMTVFVVIPAVRRGRSPWEAFGRGALFGLVAYATYDLTNHATMKDWPLLVTLVDLAWGAFLTGTVAAAAFLVTRRACRLSAGGMTLK